MIPFALTHGQAMKVNGIKMIQVDGGTPVGQRMRLLSTWMREEAYPVLVISQVGSEGINLSAARIMFLLVSDISVKLKNED